MADDLAAEKRTALISNSKTRCHTLSGRKTDLPELPTMPSLAVGEWSLPLLRARSLVCDYSRAALRAMEVVSRHSELHLRAALALTNILALYLSALLRLNAALGQTLAAAVASPGEEAAEPRGAALSGGPWRSVLLALPQLCRCVLAVCAVAAALLAVTLRSLLGVFKASGARVSSVMAFCDCTRALLSTFHTVTFSPKNALGAVCDFSH